MNFTSLFGASRPKGKTATKKEKTEEKKVPVVDLFAGLSLGNAPAPAASAPSRMTPKEDLFAAVKVSSKKVAPKSAVDSAGVDLFAFARENGVEEEVDAAEVYGSAGQTSRQIRESFLTLLAAQTRSSTLLFLLVVLLGMSTSSAKKLPRMLSFIKGTAKAWGVFVQLSLIFDKMLSPKPNKFAAMGEFTAARIAAAFPDYALLGTTLDKDKSPGSLFYQFKLQGAYAGNYVVPVTIAFAQAYQLDLDKNMKKAAQYYNAYYWLNVVRSPEEADKRVKYNYTYMATGLNDNYDLPLFPHLFPSGFEQRYLRKPANIHTLCYYVRAARVFFIKKRTATPDELGLSEEEVANCKLINDAWSKLPEIDQDMDRRGNLVGLISNSIEFTMRRTAVGSRLLHEDQSLLVGPEAPALLQVQQQQQLQLQQQEQEAAPLGGGEDEEAEEAEDEDVRSALFEKDREIADLKGKLEYQNSVMMKMMEQMAALEKAVKGQTSSSSAPPPSTPAPQQKPST